MSFSQGLSGLNVNAKALDVVGNNIANSNTAGFKVANAAFVDVYAASLAGASQIGIGASIIDINQQFTQGNIKSTSNPLDLAINGQGFYRLSNNGTITWTRDGQFHIDKDGYLVNNAGYRLTGYPTDANGNIVPSTPDDIHIDTADLPPRATGASPAATGLQIGLNLDSRESVIAAPFDINNPATYNSSTSATVYDSLGNAHLLTLYFKKTGAGAWDLYTSLDGGAAAGPTALTFDASGKLTAPTNGIISQSHAITTGATSPLDFDLNLTGSTQYGSLFGVNSIIQDGYASGRLSGLTVAPDGTIQGRYSNGQSRDLAQVVLGNFNNPNGLISLGNNQWAETAESGQAVIGVPGSSSLGVIQASALEESNVDLTEELVKLITFQRAYQANAQTIRTQDQIQQTLVNLR